MGPHYIALADLEHAKLASNLEICLPFPSVS